MLKQTTAQIQARYRALGITDQEFERASQRLGRVPNDTELGLISGMWSEHCAYKYSKPVLRTFWTKNERVMMGPGEGAGVIDIGDGKAVVFKAESHNHPSAVEPYEGAATGVGGIIRDIFSMGAQPIALLDSLAFGDPTTAHTQHLVDRIVAGIGGYGNAIGIPTVGGEINFDPAYEQNPLVNAMCVGVMDQKDLQVGHAAGVGNVIVYVGAKTGRDGINGASFASSDFDTEVAADRGAVQVGDPFMEKQLMDACLVITKTFKADLVGMQDMGAAGLVSSSVEMAAKAGSGLQLDLDQVPQRENGMTPFEIMLSESQERMLLCVRAGSEAAIMAVFHRFGLDAAVIGTVVEGDRYRLIHQGMAVCDVPVSLLTTDAPIYTQVGQKPSRLTTPAQDFVPDVTNALQLWERLLMQPTIADKHALFSQYDAKVKTNTVIGPGSDAAVIRIRGTKKALALTTDSKGRYLRLDPQIGAMMTVVESAANLVASGARPLGVTDCLNFGDPTKPEAFYELAEAAKGIVKATKQFNTPVISGNVSLYNETNGESIYPTPMIGMVGLIEDVSNVMTSEFDQAGDLIYLLGATRPDFNGTEWQKLVTGGVSGRLAPFALAPIRERFDQLTQAIQAGLVTAAHDVSDGGLAVALAEMTFKSRLSFNVTLPLPTAWLFSETPGRMLVTVAPENQANFLAACPQAQLIGAVTADQRLQIQTQEDLIAGDLEALTQAYREGLTWQLNQKD